MHTALVPRHFFPAHPSHSHVPLSTQKFSLCSRNTVASELECFSVASFSAAAIAGAPQKTTPIVVLPYTAARSVNSSSHLGRPGLIVRYGVPVASSFVSWSFCTSSCSGGEWWR